MKTIPLTAYESLAKDAEVVSADPCGEKVLRLAGGDFAKLFRRKRRISSAAWSPYATRFASAARKLKERGVPTVDVLDVFRVVEKQRDVVVYRPLPGEALRDALSASGPEADPLPRFADFLAELHQRGVYFRGIHFGNVLVIGGERFGLIDVDGARCGRRPLGLARRVRNFKPLVRDRSHRDAIARFGGRAFLERYARASGLNSPRRELLVRAVATTHEIFAN